MTEFVHVFIEVTNTLAHPSVTGLQRQTREILRHMPSMEGLEVTPVVWESSAGTHRRLTAEESRRLLADPRTGSGRRRRRLHDLPEPLHRAWRRSRWTLPGKAIALASAELRELKSSRRRTEPVEGVDALLVTAWPERSVFFDLEAAQHDPAPRSELLPRLTSEGVRTAAFVADLIPALHPEWFDRDLPVPFRSFVDAHLAHSRLFVSPSRNTEADLLRYRDFVAPDAEPVTRVVGLGVELGGAAAKRPERLPHLTGPMLLCVSTIEPRKNHLLLLDAFDELAGRHQDVNLVLVGGEGWLSRPVVERIRSHPEFRRRLHWLGDVDDGGLEWLYREAFLTVFPSFYEGFGLPVIEALGRGAATLASNTSSVPEAGGEWAEYFDPSDADELASLIDRHLTDPAHHAKVKEMLAGYDPPSWGTTTAQIADALLELGRSPARGRN